MTLRERTLNVLSRILEESAYIFTDVASEKVLPEPSAWEADGVALTFTGIENGEMRLWASKGFSRVVAANMLGVDEDDDAAAQKGLDALKESLNILLGNYLTEIYGEEPVFDLGLPKAVSPSQMAEDLGNPEAFILAAEEYPVVFIVELYNKR